MIKYVPKRSWKLLQFFKHFHYKKVRNFLFYLFFLFTVILQLYLLLFCPKHFNSINTFLEYILFFNYLFISIAFIGTLHQLEITKKSIQDLQSSNKSLTNLIDSTKAFKHDFDNIVLAIGAYITANDMPGLKNYHRQFAKDCKCVNIFSTLHSDKINNPCIYQMLVSKCNLAYEKGIQVHLDTAIDMNNLPIKIYELARIMGILLDNAIEAAIECEEKIIEIQFRKQEHPNKYILSFQNTYSQKDIDTQKIFEKNYTSKEKNSGIGLWEVNQILNKNKNLSLFTNKNPIFFIQQLEIYEK